MFRGILKDENANAMGKIRTFDWLEQNVNLEFGFMKKCQEKKEKVKRDKDDHKDQGDGMQNNPDQKKLSGKGQQNSDGDTGKQRQGSDGTPLAGSQPVINFSTTTVLTREIPQFRRPADRQKSNQLTYFCSNKTRI